MNQELNLPHNIYDHTFNRMTACPVILMRSALTRIGPLALGVWAMGSLTCLAPPHILRLNNSCPVYLSTDNQNENVNYFSKSLPSQG